MPGYKIGVPFARSRADEWLVGERDTLLVGDLDLIDDRRRGKVQTRQREKREHRRIGYGERQRRRNVTRRSRDDDP